MPSSEMIIWAGISGLILLLLGVIGYLLDSGIRGVRHDIKGLRDDLTRTHDKGTDLARENAAHKAACEERHKRLDFEISTMKGRFAP